MKVLFFSLLFIGCKSFEIPIPERYRKKNPTPPVEVVIPPVSSPTPSPAIPELIVPKEIIVGEMFTLKYCNESGYKYNRKAVFDGKYPIGTFGLEQGTNCHILKAVVTGSGNRVISIVEPDGKVLSSKKVLVKTNL